MADIIPPGDRASLAAHSEKSRRSGRDSSAAGASRSLPAPSPPLWSRPPHGPRQAYAAIDLGTNNCRLLIARPTDEHFVVIDAFSRVVRLGEGLALTGQLGEEAMNRAVNALRICAEKL